MTCVNRRTLHVITDPVSMLSEYYSYIARNVTEENDLIPWTCCAYFSCKSSKEEKKNIVLAYALDENV